MNVAFVIWVKCFMVESETSYRWSQMYHFGTGTHLSPKWGLTGDLDSFVFPFDVGRSSFFDNNYKNIIFFVFRN